MSNRLSILFHQGKQYIPDPTKAKVPGIFRGRPVISAEKVDEDELVALCPCRAIAKGPVSIDLGKCAFCGECARKYPEKIRFTDDYKMATNCRELLIVKEGEDKPITVDKAAIRPEIKGIFKHSLKLRQVSAAGDNSCEWELGATSNVNFDMGRYGIEFVASPRHADGVVVTGPISAHMAEALDICLESVPEPRISVLAGTDAISGGIFALEENTALDRHYVDKVHTDLYLPGNPCHPLTVINGLLDLTRSK